MTDRTMISLGRTSFSVPRLAKRALQVVTASGLTAFAALFIIMANSLLLGRGVTPGFETWLAFIRRADIFGAIVLTAIVTIAYLYWDRRSDSASSRR